MMTLDFWTLYAHTREQFAVKVGMLRMLQFCAEHLAYRELIIHNTHSIFST